MREARRSRANAWLPLFVFALGAFIGSVAALAAVLIDFPGDESATEAEAGVPATGTVPGNLAVRGPLPARLDPGSVLQVGSLQQADVAFGGDDGPDAFPHRYWVPVADPAAGVDRLTREAVLELAAGRLRDWSDAGGVAGPVVFVAAGDEAAEAAALRFLPGATPARVFASLEELKANFVPGSGFLALVPLEDVTVSMTAVALAGPDGPVDLVRGVGDPAYWPFADRISMQALTARGRAVLPALREQLEAKAPQVTRIVATGDILQSRCALAKIEASGDWGAALRGPVGDYLAAADLALGSLDGSIQDINPPYRCVPGTNLSSPPEVIEALSLAGIDGVTVATNHIFDCGIEYCGTRAFLRTLELLDAAGIKHVGGGKNLEEALTPAIFEVNGVRFGVLGFDDVAAMELEASDDDPGTAPMDDDYREERAAGEPAFYRPANELSVERMTERIRRLKAEVDVVVVQIQSGTEDTHTPTERSIKALRAAADAGANLVVGNQAHWVQAVEWRNDSFIAYALGNFIFDQQHTPEHEQGYLLEATFWGSELRNVRFVPYRIKDQHRPTFVDGEERAKILGDVFGAEVRE